MVFNSSYQLKYKESLWIDVIFYFLYALIIAVVFSYFILMVKVYIDSQAVNELDNRTANHEFSQQKIYEKEILDYQKKIDNYSAIVSRYKISSNILSFIEQTTLSNVWFLSLDMSQLTDEIKLSGQAENMEVLGRQIQVFEKSQDYINHIKVFNSDIEPSGKVRFILNLSLNPKIFSYKPTI